MYLHTCTLSDNTFTCSKCLSSFACDGGEEVIISFTIHIDKYFIMISDCEVQKNEILPVCILSSGKCSLVFTSYNISDNYVIHCPIINSFSYGILSEKIDLDGDLPPCSSKYLIALLCIWSNNLIEALNV